MSSRSRSLGVCCVLLLGCGEIPSQGSVALRGTANGDTALEREVPVTSATLGGSVGGWLAVEVWDMEPSTGILFDGAVGALCLWIHADALASGEIPASWPAMDPPFTREEWRCLPPADSQAPVFMGILCPVHQSELLPDAPGEITPSPATPTPGDLVIEPIGATPSPAETTVPWLRATGGRLSVQAAGGEACDEILLTLSGISFQNQDCGGPLSALSLDTFTLKVRPLPAGRSWGSGGWRMCSGAARGDTSW